MTQILEDFAEVSGRYDAVFCDLWGCVHNGHEPFPAAVAALQAYRRKGGKVVLMTNAPRPKSSVVKQLDRMGCPRDCWDEVVSSGDAAQYAMLTGAVGHKVYFIGAPQHDSFFDSLAPDLEAVAAREPPVTLVPLEEAEGCVCTGLVDDRTETPEDYTLTLKRMKNRNLPMLCVNPDIMVDWGDKRLWCAGALARDYEAMGGKVFYFGKPHPPIYDLARRRLAALGVPPNPEILCIGDGIATDIQGGMGEDLDTLFITGGLSTAEFGPDAEHPDPALLNAWLTERQMSATFAMGKLR